MSSIWSTIARYIACFRDDFWSLTFESRTSSKLSSQTKLSIRGTVLVLLIPSTGHVSSLRRCIISSHIPTSIRNYPKKVQKMFNMSCPQVTSVTSLQVAGFYAKRMVSMICIAICTTAVICMYSICTTTVYISHRLCDRKYNLVIVIICASGKIISVNSGVPYWLFLQVMIILVGIEYSQDYLSSSWLPLSAPPRPIHSIGEISTMITSQCSISYWFNLWKLISIIKQLLYWPNIGWALKCFSRRYKYYEDYQNLLYL